MSRSKTAGLVAAVAIGLGVAGMQLQRVQAQQASSVCGWIGVQVSPMTTAFADSLGMTEIYGATFERPEPGSPAANAHIEAGDVITSINGAKLVHPGDFATTIAQTAPGTTVYLSTWRDRQLIERQVVVGSSQCRGSRK